MADIKELGRALIAADKAGDTESAQLFANEIRRMQSQTQGQPTPPSNNDAPDTSLGGAFSQGVDQAGAMVGKGLQSGGELIGLEAISAYGSEMAQRNEAEIAESNYQRPQGADGIISNLRKGEFGNAATSALYGAVEAAPQVAGGVAASIGAGLAATTAPVVGTALAVGGTGYGVVNALGQNRAEKEDQGLDPTATATDLASAVASGLVELTPIKGGGATLKVLREAGQEAVQEGLVIGGTSVQGGEYVAQDVVDRLGDAAITGGIVAKGANMAITTVNKAGSVVMRPREQLDPEVDQASGDVARMVSEIAETEGYNLKDIDPSSQKGANAALAAARSKLAKDIETATTELKINVLKGASQEVKSQFKAAEKQARNKVSSVVTQENIDFIKDNFGSTKQGQQLAQAYRKSNILTEVYSSGLKGGISQFTDQFNPLPSFGRAFNPSGIIAGNLNAGAAVATGGATLAAQIPLVIGGRAIDGVTGRRSKVARFVKQNQKKDGLAPVTGVSVQGRAQRLKEATAAAKQQLVLAEKAKNEATNVQSYENGFDPNPISPRGTLFEAIKEKHEGAKELDAPSIDAEVARVLDAAEVKYADQPITLDAIAEYRKMLSTGRMTKVGKPLSYVIALVKDGWSIEAKPKSQTKASKKQSALSPQAEAGKQSNMEVLGGLRQGMLDDPSVSTGDKTILKDAFDTMTENLGSDPVTALKATIESAKSRMEQPHLAEKHLGPYLTRVLGQQSAARAKGKPKDGKKPQEPQPEPAPTPKGGDGPSGQGNAGGVLSGPPNKQPRPIQLAKPKVPASEKPALKKAAPKAVEKALPKAKAIVEIGKKGSKYEDGIQDFDTALEVAKTLGITVAVMNSGTALQKTTGSSKGTAALHSWGPTMKGFGSEVFAIKPGGSFNGVKTSKIEALQTLLHEMGHSLTQGNMDGVGPFGKATITNMVNNSSDSVGANSFNNSVMAPLLNGLKPDHPAIQEIQSFQEAGSVYTQNDPSQKLPPRQLGEFIAALSTMQQRVDSYDGTDVRKIGNLQKLLSAHKMRLKRTRFYTNLTPELSVDPMLLYLMNPKLAKDVMPVMTKLIKAEFDKANNGKILFFSHPFATVLAVVTAMAAAAASTEDDEEQPRGALSA